jgi:hypothetical protein
MNTSELSKVSTRAGICPVVERSLKIVCKLICKKDLLNCKKIFKIVKKIFKIVKI